MVFGVRARRAISDYQTFESKDTMDLKTGLNELADGATHAIDNAKDAVSEAGHRSAAEAEHAKRDVAGEQMTTSEKIGSVVNQTKHTVQADIDASKRDVRNHT